MSDRGGADLLTRTTLTLDAGTPPPSIAHVMHALRRVPGVLLAEVDAGATRAMVAHDSGVPPDSLVAAAARAGVRTTIVRANATGPEPRTTAPIDSARTFRLFLFAMAAYLALTAVQIATPSGTGKAIVTIVGSLWVIFFMRSLFSRSG